MKLPAGVYVVSEEFRERTGNECFSFQGQQYEAEIAVNAPASLLISLILLHCRRCGHPDVY